MKSMMAHGEIQFLAVLLAALASVGYARAPRKILNGENVSILDFPYLAILHGHLLGGLSYNFCAGTIIDAKHILTAAHCVYETNSAIIISPEKFEVITGIDNLHHQSTENTFEVLRVIPHADYNNAGEAENDIAILKLNGSMSFNNVRKPAELSEENISEGTEAIVTGWGKRRINQSEPLDPELQKLSVTVYDPAECSLKTHWHPYSSKICTMSEGNGSACGGDSGDPLSFNGKVIGVLSTSNCGPGLPAIFTRVHSYLPWIRNITEG